MDLLNYLDDDAREELLDKLLYWKWDADMNYIQSLIDKEDENK